MVGGGSVYWKNNKAQNYIINDKNKEVYNLYKTAKNFPSKVKSCDISRVSKKEFNKIKNKSNPSSCDVIKKFKHSFGADGKSYVNKNREHNNNFGGSTIKPITLGCWIDPKRKGRLQCETGFAIEAWRDFDSDKKMKNFNNSKKEAQLQKDKQFMKRIANEAAFEFGQASVPAVFDRVDSVDLMEGEWKPKIEKNKVGKKIKGNLFNKYI